MFTEIHPKEKMLVFRPRSEVRAGIEKTVNGGGVEDTRKRGRPMKSWIGEVQEWTKMDPIMLWHGHRTNYIRLALQHMDRPPVVARVETEDVPACCVFDADTRI